MGVVVWGDGMVRGRSGMEVENRIMRVRGEKAGGEGDEVIMSGILVVDRSLSRGGVRPELSNESSRENESFNFNRDFRSTKPQQVHRSTYLVLDRCPVDSQPRYILAVFLI